jgi:hypothetical protein
MFGHLKAEEFMSLIDGMSVTAARRAHLNACAVCSNKLQSMEATHNQLAATDLDIPEPDWEEFRASVRLQLLSRSVKRESIVRRWTGWAMRPAMAWGLSLTLLVCVGTGGFLWHVSRDITPIQTEVVEAPVNDSPTVDTDTDLTAWSGTTVFQELGQLEKSETERLRQLLQSAQSEQSPNE